MLTGSSTHARRPLPRNRPSGPPSRSRRCLVVADGFYEWTPRGRARQPWLFEIDGGALFAFAGLWENWTVPAGAALPPSLIDIQPGMTIETCTILTTAANAVVAPVHHRMPVILPPTSYDAWLAGEHIDARERTHLPR